MRVLNRQGIMIIDPRIWHKDDALDGDWRPATAMILNHSKNDPQRDVRVATHQLMVSLHCDNSRHTENRE